MSSNKVENIKLNGGIPLALSRIPDADTVTVAFSFDVGSADESPSERGLCHLIEHLIAAESPLYPKPYTYMGKVTEAGGSFNAMTDVNECQFYFTIPKKKVDFAIEGLLSAISNGIFNETAFKREKSTVVAELLQAESDPVSIFQQKIFDVADRTAPYANGGVGGYTASVKALTIEQATKFYHKFFCKNRLRIAVVGNFGRTNTLIENLNIGLAPLVARGNGPAIQSWKPFIKSKQSSLKLNMNSNQDCFIVIVYELPGTTKKNHVAQITRHLLAFHLGKGINSVFGNELRIKPGLSYTFGVDFDETFHRSKYNLWFRCAPENVDQCLKILGQATDKLMQEGLPEKDFKKLVKTVANQQKLDLCDEDTRIGRMLYDITLFGQARDIDAPLDTLKQITLREFNADSKGLLSQEPILLAILQP